MKFRDYQSKSIEKALCFLCDETIEDNGIIVLPTGSGKSLVITGISAILDEPIVIFQPSKEILEQNYQKLIDYGAFDISIFSASLNRKRVSKITLATIGSAINKPDLFKHFKYVLIDECDLVNPEDGMYKKFLDIIKPKVLGLTASPWRMYNNREGTQFRFITRTNPRVFNRVVHYEQISTMVERNYWSKIVYYPIKGFDTSKLKLKSTGSGYTEESIRKYYEEIKFENKLTKVISRLLDIGRKNILVFTEFVEESEVLTKIYPGICECVSADTKKKDRERILNDFKSGKVKIVCNVGVLTVGFDFPQLETIVMARPTRSLRLYYQIIGRGVRPDFFGTKEDCWFVDLCDNIKRFGKIENLVMERDYKNKWIISNEGRQLTNVYIP